MSVFIGRREDRTIYGLWSVRQWDGQEKLADDHAEVVAFRERELVIFVKTIEQKLALIGITLADLKSALGIK